MSGLALEWGTRHEPRVPEALWAPRAAIGALCERLLRADDDQLGRLRGVVTDESWIVIGPTEALPWVDGLTYLARDPEAPSLWVPTYASLSPAATLVERAIRARFGGGPFALHGSPLALVPLSGARRLDRERMRAAAEEAR